MRYKLFSSLTLSSLLTISTVMANDCSKEAMEQANNQYLQEISSYISQFSNQKNQAAVIELNNIKPSTDFKRKHAKEISQFDDVDYKPSTEFCADAYDNLDKLRYQLTDIINKYKPQQ